MSAAADASESPPRRRRRTLLVHSSIIPPVSHLPMLSDDEETNVVGGGGDNDSGGTNERDNDPYSAAYHAKMAAKRNRSLSNRTPTDIIDVYDEQSRFPTAVNAATTSSPVPRMSTPQAASDNSNSNLQIVSVRSLPASGAAGFFNTFRRNSRKGSTLPDVDNRTRHKLDAENTIQGGGSASSSADAIELRQMLDKPAPVHRPMFGIARTNNSEPADDSRASASAADDDDGDDNANENDDDDDGELLVPIVAEKSTKTNNSQPPKPMGRPRKYNKIATTTATAPTRKGSKLSSIRNAYVKKFGSQLTSKTVQTQQPIGSKVTVKTDQTSAQASVSRKPTSSGVPQHRIADEHVDDNDRLRSGGNSTDDSTSNVAAQQSAKAAQTSRSTTQQPSQTPIAIGIAERIKRSSRRKTTHRPLAEDDMDIEFEVASAKSSPPIEPAASTSTAVSDALAGASTNRRRVGNSGAGLLQSLDEWIGQQPQPLRDRMQLARTIPNPNIDLMEKLAFLRTCINYMLRELDRPEMRFERAMSYEKLRKQYKCSNYED